MVIIQAPGHPQGSELDTTAHTMSPEALAHPGGGPNESKSIVLKVLGGHIGEIILLIGLPINPWWIAPPDSQYCIIGR